MPKILPPQLHCFACGRMVDNKDFFKNYNKYHEEYNYSRMSLCKSCCKEVANDIMTEYWSPQKNKEDRVAYSLGIRAICTFFHMPYLNEAMNSLRDYELNSTKDKNFNYISLYGSALNDLGVPKEYWNNLSGNTFLAYDLFNQSNNNDARLTSDGDMELLLRLEKEWGKLDCLEDYLWLEEKFEEYASGENLKASMKTTMKYLCLAELDVMKLKQNKENTKDAEKKVMEYYKSLGLDKFKLQENKTEIEKSIEDWANIFENIEPLEWEDKEGILKDRLGFEKDYENIMRSLGNKVVGMKEYPNLTFDDVKKGRKKK